MKSKAIVVCAALSFSAAVLHATGFVTYASDSSNHDGTTPPTRPAYLSSYADPDFNVTVTRISDSTTAVDGSTNLSNGVYWGNTVRNVYWNVQPWNADMSLLLIQNESFDAAGHTLTGPSPKRLILDGSTYAFKYGLSFQPYEYRWHPTDPDTLFYTINNSLYKYSVSGGTSTLIQTFSKYPNSSGAILLDNSMPSADGRYLVIEAPYGGGKDVFVYDTTVLSPSNGSGTVKNFTTNNGYSFKSAWISPSGSYVIVNWDDSFTEVYDTSMTLVQTLTLSGMSHFDVAWSGGTAGSSEYAVGVHKNPGSGGYIYSCPLIGTTYTDLITVGYGADASARNFDYPGWAYAGYLNNGTSYPLDNEVCGINLNSTSNSTIRRLGHFFNTRVDYASEVHACPSPDGMRIIFQSNWNNRGGNGRGTDAYVIDLRPLLPFNDDFENDEVFTANWTVSDTAYVWQSADTAFGSTYSMHMKGKSDASTNAYLTNAVSTVGFSTVSVQYAITTSGLVSGHEYYLDWYDGSSWHLAADAVGNTNQWGIRNVSLPSGAAGISGFKIRFRTDATGTNEVANFDNVRIIAQ